MTTKELLSQVDKMPKIPKVVQELMDLVNHPDAEMNKISEKISQDPVISARILRLSNSAHFGRGKSVSSIEEAVIRVGLSPIRTLVTASALMSSFPQIDGLDLKIFWGTTFEVATLCKGLAKQLKADQNEAFTAAMLHNIGDLLIYTIYPDKIEKVALHVEAGKSKPEAQQIVLNTDCAKVGGALAKNWKFTDKLIYAISNQFTFTQKDEYHQLPAMINLARKIDENWDAFSNDEIAKKDWLLHQLEYSILGCDEKVFDEMQEQRGAGRELAQSLI